MLVVNGLKHPNPLVWSFKSECQPINSIVMSWAKTIENVSHFKFCFPKIRILTLGVLIYWLSFRGLMSWQQKATEERLVTVWLAAMSLMPLWQLSWTCLSHPLSLKKLYLIELSSLGQSNTVPNGRTLTKITSDSNYKRIQLHISYIADVSHIRLIVPYQSNCHL